MEILGGFCEKSTIYDVICIFMCPSLAVSDSTLRITSETGIKTVKRVTAQANSVNKVALAAAPIRSTRDLLIYQKMTPAKESPLHLLSPNARRQFLESLDFNERGVTGFDYSILENELTPTQIFRVLALLGSQSATAKMVRAKKLDLNDTVVTSSLLSDSGYCGFDIRCPPSPTGSGPYDEGGGGFDWPDSYPGQGDYDPPNADFVDFYCTKDGACAVRQGYICKITCLN